jgi:hypothetical protein
MTHRFEELYEKLESMDGKMDTFLTRQLEIKNKLDYIVDPNKYNYSSYEEWLKDKQVNLRVYNNGSIE